jgi:glycine amidinotransferase
MKLNSHNEWDKLKEVIVGSAKNSCAVMVWNNNNKKINIKITEEAKKLSKLAYPQWLIDETEEDLDNLSKILKNYGAKVFRPKIHNLNNFINSPFWTCTNNNSYNARDLNLVVGNNLIESPSQHSGRYFETLTYYDIWYKHYFNLGFNWICAPKPRLDYKVLEPLIKNKSLKEKFEAKQYKILTKGKNEKFHKLKNIEILFEAANTLRVGKDLLYLVSSSGNLKGAKWLQSVLGEQYKVHITQGIYKSSHIDSTIMCLKPGLVLLNSVRVNKKSCPKIFHKWDKLWFDEVAQTSDQELNFQKNIREPIYNKLLSLGFDSNLKEMSSPWVGMNILSLDQKTIIVDERQKKLIKLLQSKKFEIITARMRHMYTMGGGLHCSTLDTVRDSKLESYI